MHLAMLDMRCEIGGHLVDGPHQGVIILDTKFQNFMDPLDEEIAVLFRDAEHVSNGANRNMLGVACRGVALSVRDEFVDQLVADRTNPRFQFLHGVGRERRQQQLLGGLVLGWVGGDRWRRRRDVGADVAHDDAARGKMLGIVGDFLHRFIGGRQIAAEEALGVDHRAFRPQFFPDRKRVFGPARIGVVEIADPISDRRMLRHYRGGIGHRGNFLRLGLFTSERAEFVGSAILRSR